MRAAFEQQAKDLGLEANFLFLGRRSDVPAILACCDIAVLPSLAEGLPNAVLEYLAAGLPVVATALGRESRDHSGWSRPACWCRRRIRRHWLQR